MVDIIVVSAYLMLILFAGLYNTSKNSSLLEFGRIGSDLNNNILILTATIFASAVGGGTIFGLTEKIYNGNIGYSYGLLLAIPIDLMIAKFLVPKFLKYKGAASIGEIVGMHYGRIPRIITGFSAALISIGYLSAQIAVSGIIFSSILKIDYFYGILASYLITIIYATFGGFRSIVINNTIQFIAMILAIPALCLFSFYHASAEVIGFSNIWQIYSEKSQNIYNETFFAFTSFAVMGLCPTLIQRILAGRNANIITNAIYIKSLVYFMFIIFISINGILALLLVPLSPPSFAMPNLIELVVPEGFRGLIGLGLLASVMSTADSDLNVASISIVNDIIKPLIPHKSSLYKKVNLIFLAKLVSILIGSTSILLAMQFSSIVDIVIFAAGLWAPIAIVPIIGILYGVVLSDLAFYTSAFFGAAGFVLTEIFYKYSLVSGVCAGCSISALTFILIWKTGWGSRKKIIS